MGNHVEIDFCDIRSMRELMSQHSTFSNPMLGEDQDGDICLTSIFEDKIIVKTYQSNGWIRKVYLHHDGTVEELYER